LRGRQRGAASDTGVPRKPDSTLCHLAPDL